MRQGEYITAHIHIHILITGHKILFKLMSKIILYIPYYV